jgi:hypothetical protein
MISASRRVCELRTHASSTARNLRTVTTQEAEGISNGIIVDWAKLNVFPDAAGMQHCEVTAVLDMYPSWMPKLFLSDR